MKRFQLNIMADFLESNLEKFVREIAEGYNSEDYIREPDFVEPRLHAWHQFGLITHTKKVRNAFLYELPNILKNFGVYEKIIDKLNERIGITTKSILFESSIPLHDLGKIALINDLRVNREHEEVSSYLLSQEPIKSALSYLKLNSEQVDYIRQCILFHDVLGKELRDPIKHAGKLSLDYLALNPASPEYSELIKKYNDMRTEMGIFFICDLLGKTDFRVVAQNEKELRSQEKQIELELKKRNLPPELKSGVTQFPVSLKLAENYFKCLFNQY